MNRQIVNAKADKIPFGSYHPNLTTAYHQYAVEGFELNVTDYLLKPFYFERFLQAVNKVIMLLIGNVAVAGQKAAKEFLYVTVQKRNVKIWFSDIFYI